MSKFLFKSNDLVFASEGIGITGATGAETAPHLHFAMKEDGRFVDPIPLLRAIPGLNRKAITKDFNLLLFK